MEGNLFVIDKLVSGAVLNYRSIFTEDTMVVNIRASQPTHLLELNEKDFEYLKLEDQGFDKKINMYQHNLYKS